MNTLTPAGRSSRWVASMRARRGSFLTGCLTILAIVLVLGGVGVFYVSQHWRSWAARGSRDLIAQVVEASKLSEDERAGVMAHVDTLAQDFEDGKVTFSQLTRVASELKDSPLFPLSIVHMFQSQYVQPSSLSDEEKSAGRLALQRLARGIYEESIPVEAIDEVAVPIAKPRNQPRPKAVVRVADKGWELKQPGDVTPEELRTFLANAKARADSAEIPDEPFEVDIVAEVGAVIDRALHPEAIESAAEGKQDGDENKAIDQDNDQHAEGSNQDQPAETEQPPESPGGG